MKVDTDQLDEEKLKVIDNKIAEVAELKRQLSGMKERSDVLRTSLLQDMELMGLVGNGDSLTSEHLGVYIELVDTKQYRIDKEILLSLGISEDILAQATVEKQVRPHIRLMTLPDPEKGGTKGGTNAMPGRG